MKIIVKSIDGHVILSTVELECLECLEGLSKEYESLDCPNGVGKCRRSMLIQKDRHIWLCSHTFKTTKNFKEAVQVYVSVLPHIEQSMNEVKEATEAAERGITKSLLHNLVNQNAHTIQLLDQFLPQNERFADVSVTIANTKNKVENAPDKVALALFKLKKIASSMKAEFSVFNRFRNENTTVNPKVYKLFDVVKIVAHIFFADLHENNIYVSIEQCYEKGYFDFEVMRVALYYIFENAVKYVKRNSQINVNFGKEGNRHSIIISMESLYVEPQEVEHIFEKGFSGSNAKKSNKAGNGLGMYHARELINLANGDICFIAGSKVSTKYGGDKYAKNLIKILVPQVPNSVVLYEH